MQPEVALLRLQEWQRLLQQQFEAEQDRRPRHKQLEAPRWPDLSLMGLPSEPGSSSSALDGALGVARWAARLIDTFAELTDLQAARNYLTVQPPNLVADTRDHQH